RNTRYPAFLPGQRDSLVGVSLRAEFAIREPRYDSGVLGPPLTRDRLAVTVLGEHQLHNPSFVCVANDAVAAAVGEEVVLVRSRPCECRGTGTERVKLSIPKTSPCVLHRINQFIKRKDLLTHILISHDRGSPFVSS